MNKDFLKYILPLYSDGNSLRRIRTAIRDIYNICAILDRYGKGAVEREITSMPILYNEHYIWKHLAFHVIGSNNTKVLETMADNLISAIADSDITQRYVAYLYYLGALAISLEEDAFTLFKSLLFSTVPMNFSEDMHKYIATIEEDVNEE